MGCCLSKSEDDGKLVRVRSKRAKFFATYQNQNFSFRGPLMYYIAMNPSTPEVYQKMIQSWKYFFAKNPILVVSCFPHYDGNLWSLNKMSFDLNQTACKFWITYGCYTSSSEYVKAVIPKLFRCEARRFGLHDQTISFHDLLLLVPSVEWITFNNLVVKDEYGLVVPLEKVFQGALKANACIFHNCTITSETMKELFEIPHFQKLDYISMCRLSEDFDLDAFYDYMKKNQCTHFRLKFDDSISDAYKTRLEEIVDEIIATETFGYKPPCISFDGLDGEKQRELNRTINSHW